MAIEVGRIDDGNHDIRARLLGPPAQEQIDRDHLVGAARSKAVGPWEIDQIDGHGTGCEVALLQFDRDTWVVADALAEPGESVE